MSDIKKTYTNEKISWVQLVNKCEGCGLCVDMCPQNALEWDNEQLNAKGEPTIKCEIGNCVMCRICENMCSDAAIELQA